MTWQSHEEWRGSGPVVVVGTIAVVGTIVVAGRSLPSRILRDLLRKPLGAQRAAAARSPSARKALASEALSRYRVNASR